ncbi:response regulator [bacterium]|nr:response regulator [bacterium]
MGEAKILIVEDENIVAKDIKNILKGIGYNVVGTASSGEEALEKVNDSMPDLVLMDIVLAGKMNGIDTAEEIHNNFKIPVVYLTAYADKKTLEKAKVTEPYGYILKPFGDRELETVIEMALYKYQMEKKLRENEERYRSLIEGVREAIFRMTLPEGDYEYFSPAAKLVFGYDASKFVKDPLFIKKIIHPSSEDYIREKWAELAKGIVDPIYEYKILDSKNNERWIMQSNKGLFDDEGNLIAIEGICRGITERKKAEESLRKAHDELERKVKERTVELEKKNTALKEVLAYISEEKLNIRREITSDIDQVLIPILAKLKRAVDPNNLILVELIESGLRELATSPLNVLSVYSKLSPREIEICNMVKNGLTSKEISAELNIAPTTVQKHRQQMRKKLGITNDKINLRSYLLSLT